MFEFWQYIRFQLSARTEYGVHSPFVYGLLTDAVYRRPRFHGFEKERLARRIASYLGCPGIKTIKDLNWSFAEYTPSKTAPWGFGDLVVYPSPTEAVRLLDTLDKNCVLFIHRPYANREQLRALIELFELSPAEVGLDFFWGAVLIPRRGQHRERFRIRLKL